MGSRLRVCQRKQRRGLESFCIWKHFAISIARKRDPPDWIYNFLDAPWIVYQRLMACCLFLNNLHGHISTHCIPWPLQLSRPSTSCQLLVEQIRSRHQVSHQATWWRSAVGLHLPDLPVGISRDGQLVYSWALLLFTLLALPSPPPSHAQKQLNPHVCAWTRLTSLKMIVSLRGSDSHSWNQGFGLNLASQAAEC